MAEHLDVETKDRDPIDVARDVAEAALAEFGRQTGSIKYLERAPKKRQQIWQDLRIAPRGVDREVVDIMHRTHAGNDQEAEHILDAGMRNALADGWGGSMLSTDITDILFGTPAPLHVKTNMGALSETEVNIIVHGHEPVLSEMILAAVQDPEMIEYAKSKGAEGITLAGICCTANETLMRQGVPTVGNFLSQELAILTGAVEAMVVDIQCIMQNVARVADNFHTLAITTSPKAKIEGAIHVEFEEHHALDIAKKIVKMAIDQFPERGKTRIPNVRGEFIAGFSHEYLNYMLGGRYRESLRPLNDAIMAGRIRGVAGVVGCNNARVTHDEVHNEVTRELLKNDVLVVDTGCSAIACSKFSLMEPEAMEQVGAGLREICEALGIPPVIHLGSCVDNTRILTIAAQMATEGGLGEDIADLPAVGIAPEWMSEKAISIGTYFVASGVYVIFNQPSPVEGSEEVVDLITNGWQEKVGGQLVFAKDAKEIVELALARIDESRAALGLPEWDPNRFGESGDSGVKELLEAPEEERLLQMRSLKDREKVER